MIISQLFNTTNLKHLKSAQYGAFVAHCMAQPRFDSITINDRKEIIVSYAVAWDSPQEGISAIQTLALLDHELKALESLEPFPCCCGCGAFIAINPCFRQSEQIVEFDLSDDEKHLICQHQTIEAIKKYRARTGITNLTEIKELCDKWIQTPEYHSMYKATQGHYPGDPF